MPSRKKFALTPNDAETGLTTAAQAAHHIPEIAPTLLRFYYVKEYRDLGRDTAPSLQLALPTSSARQLNLD